MKDTEAKQTEYSAAIVFLLVYCILKDACDMQSIWIYTISIQLKIDQRVSRFEIKSPAHFDAWYT